MVAKLMSSFPTRATDINEQACRTTLKCALHNKAAGRVEAVNTDLSVCLNDKLESKVDVLVFNPPYVPTENSEVIKGFDQTPK